MEYKFKAFISYNHNDRDSRVAEALHKRIENYTVPRKLRQKGEKKPGKVFRDQEELSVSSDLNQHIRDALDESEFLIVICSPGAVASKWVCKEIAYFLEHHKQEKLLTVLTDGNGADIYKALLPGMPEPLSLDLTGIPDEEIPRKLKERFLKLCAPLLGCDYDDLVMRESKRQRRVFLGWLAGITAVAAIIIGILLWSNWKIEGKNAELAQQNREILLRESEMLTQEAVEALEQEDSIRALEYLVSALPSPGNERPYYAPAEKALFSALNLFDSIPDVSYYLSNTTLQQETSIDDFCISQDGTYIATVDSFGAITCYNAATGLICWYEELNDHSHHYDCCQVRSCGINNSVLVSTCDMIVAKSWETGETIWSEEYGMLDSESLLLSPDEKILALKEVYSYDDGYTNEIMGFYSAVDGTFLSAVDMEKHMLWNTTIFYGMFSEDGTKFSGIAQESVPDSTEKTLNFFVIDVMSGSFDVVYSTSYTAIDRSDYEVQDFDVYFCDNDTSLLILTAEPESVDPFFCTKVDVDTGEVLWENYVDVEVHLDPFMYSNDFYVLFFGDTILLFRNTEMFLMDLQTGEQLSLNMESAANSSTCMSYQIHTMLNGIPEKVVMAEKIDDSSFACVTENGYYVIGYVHEGVFEISSRFGYWLTLENEDHVSKAEMWNGGSFQFSEYSNSTNNLRFGSESDGMGYVAVLNWDRTSVAIKRPIILTFDYNQTIIHNVGSGFRKQYYTKYEESLIQDEVSLTQIPVLESNGVISIWDAETGSVIKTISTPFPSNSIRTYKIILDNQFLLLIANDIVVVYSIESEKLVFEFDYWEMYISEVSCWEDKENNRLYLIGYDFIACISLEDWTLLTTIDDVIQFDPETKMIYQLISDYRDKDDIHNDLVCFCIPTTEELVELAREFLEK